MIRTDGNPRNGIVHVIGAGMAGLGAAVHAAALGHDVRVWEVAGQAGGRCRSFYDTVLDRLIDNGNHLILGGNHGVFRYLSDIGAEGALTPLTPAVFPFFELPSRRQWTIRPSRGPIPFWIFSSRTRIPDTNLGDYLAARRLDADPNATVADCVDPTRPIFERFWQPLSRAVLNTDATEAAAPPLGLMLRETLLKGAAASRPYLAEKGLSAALVEPALNYLQQHDGKITFNQRLRSIVFDKTRATTISVGDDEIALAANDHVILAIPPHELQRHFPEMDVPQETRPIVNLHFRTDPVPEFPDGASILGLIGTNAQWLFKRDDILSVTISDAGVLADQTNDEIATTIWREIADIFELGIAPIPTHRVIKEQRATIAQTPDQLRRRLPAATKWQNLFLAGDWTDTGLPATIDGALRSGYHAVDLALATQN